MILTPSSDFSGVTCRKRGRWLPGRSNFLAARNCPRLLSHVATVKWFTSDSALHIKNVVRLYRLILPSFEYLLTRPDDVGLVQTFCFSQIWTIEQNLKVPWNLLHMEMYCVTFHSMSTNTEPCKSGRNKDKLKTASTWQPGWHLHCSNEKWNTEPTTEPSGLEI